MWGFGKLSCFSLASLVQITTTSGISSIALNAATVSENNGVGEWSCKALYIKLFPDCLSPCFWGTCQSMCWLLLCNNINVCTIPFTHMLPLLLHYWLHCVQIVYMFCITIFMLSSCQSSNERSPSVHSPWTAASALANPLRLFCCFSLIEVSVGSLWYSWLD